MCVCGGSCIGEWGKVQLVVLQLHKSWDGGAWWCWEHGLRIYSMSNASTGAVPIQNKVFMSSCGKTYLSNCIHGDTGQALQQ